MKYIFILFFPFYMLSQNSECQYNFVKFDHITKKIYLQLKPVTLDVYETPFNGRIILANFIREGDQYFIEIEITTDSSAQDLEPICFKRGDRLSLSLMNNRIVTISQIEKKICGIRVKNRKSKYITGSNYAKFILTQCAYDKLLKSEVVMMKINGENYDKTFVLRDELKEVKNDQEVITNPSRFFIDNIECMTNPKFD